MITIQVCGEPAPGPQPEPDPPATTTTTAPPARPSPAEAEAQLLALANDARAEAGVAPLSARADVAEIAAGWSATMSRNGSLSHNDEYFSDATKERLDAGLRGENVAFAGDIEQVHRALMDSPPHRANILDARFSVVGMGALYADGRWWVTQDFLQPRTRQAPARGPAPAVDAAPDERARALPAAAPADAAPADAAQAPAREVEVLSASPVVPDPLESGAPVRRPVPAANDLAASGIAGSTMPLGLVALALAGAAGAAMLVLPAGRIGRYKK